MRCAAVVPIVPQHFCAYISILVVHPTEARLLRKCRNRHVQVAIVRLPLPRRADCIRIVGARLRGAFLSALCTEG